MCLSLLEFWNFEHLDCFSDTFGQRSLVLHQSPNLIILLPLDIIHTSPSISVPVTPSPQYLWILICPSFFCVSWDCLLYIDHHFVCSVSQHHLVPLDSRVRRFCCSQPLLVVGPIGLCCLSSDHIPCYDMLDSGASSHRLVLPLYMLLRAWLCVPETLS